MCAVAELDQAFAHVPSATDVLVYALRLVKSKTRQLGRTQEYDQVPIRRSAVLSGRKPHVQTRRDAHCLDSASERDLSADVLLTGQILADLASGFPPRPVAACSGSGRPAAIMQGS